MRKEKLRIVNEVLASLSTFGYGVIRLVDNAGYLCLNGRRTIKQFKELCLHENIHERHGGCLDCNANGCEVI